MEQLEDGVDEALAMRVKQIERTTNHDVKAVEYVIKVRGSYNNLPHTAATVSFHVCRPTLLRMLGILAQNI